jgi:hypothetical protein
MALPASVARHLAQTPFRRGRQRLPCSDRAPASGVPTSGI